MTDAPDLWKYCWKSYSRYVDLLLKEHKPDEAIKVLKDAPKKVLERNAKEHKSLLNKAEHVKKGNKESFELKPHRYSEHKRLLCLFSMLGSLLQEGNMQK